MQTQQQIPVNATVLVSIPSGITAGTILRGGLVDRLLAAHDGVEVVIVSPLVRDPVFVREFERPRVRLEDLPPHQLGGLEARLMALIQAGYLDSAVSESVKIRREEATLKKTVRFIRVKRLLAGLLAPSMLRKPTRYALIDRLIVHRWARDLFDRYQPALLVTSSPGLIFAEIPLLRTAVQRGVRTIAVEPSWDNFTNKLIPVRRVDRIAVWNDIMKRQAVELHGYVPDHVHVCGPPHWDRYFRPVAPVSRETFFTRIGADPSRRLITLMTTAKGLYAHFDRIIRVLMAAIDNGQWGPSQLLVRVHPRDDMEAYAEFRGRPHLIVEKPFRPTVRSGDGLEVDVTSESQQHLADTLRHSDVIVTAASTIAIEASIFDTPIVDVAFDGETPTEFVKSVRRYYQFTHYSNITRQGAAPVAGTPEELVSYVGRYLKDRSLDREGRRKVVLDQCEFTDGHSSERLANVVVEELADVRGWDKRHARPALRARA
jgi:CDP-glycerol:poly(glycerophosphate) glycerophosphotransferase